jgi:hypothetical protein
MLIICRADVAACLKHSNLFKVKFFLPAATTVVQRRGMMPSPSEGRAWAVGHLISCFFSGCRRGRSDGRYRGDDPPALPGCHCWPPCPANGPASPAFDPPASSPPIFVRMIGIQLRAF